MYLYPLYLRLYNLDTHAYVAPECALFVRIDETKRNIINFVQYTYYRDSYSARISFISHSYAHARTHAHALSLSHTYSLVYMLYIIFIITFFFHLIETSFSFVNECVRCRDLDCDSTFAKRPTTQPSTKRDNAMDVARRMVRATLIISRVPQVIKKRDSFRRRHSENL